ncbi:alpha/beta hydrolase family protein [Gordonia humi]|uniref:Pimeloyl-ACP methyl ester carboxylesterase n=1 Tax=Gordonia humi TaxID=686429 RepID=A0A840F6M5_9ACTN|nr:alpha/beta fold hydrolase [Gordonia humi]MBB4138203.1 pimeloyl-ACP methyl ester carboxylesterase [Gordonia humi]
MSVEPMQRSSSDIVYRFQDREMDFAFQYALGAAKTGGLDAGELHYIASNIEDGSGASWVTEFERYGDAQYRLAMEWAARGRRRSAGELLMKAYYCYRQAWQFSGNTEAFDALIDKYESAFSKSTSITDPALTSLDIPFGESTLPGLFLDRGPQAPTVIFIGGLDSCKEEMYHLIGLNAWRRGYTAVIVDLPGQGSTPNRGLHLMSDAAVPIGAVIDYLIETRGQDPARLAIMGMSAGGYLVSRAVMTERRLAACIASTPIYDGGGILPREAIEQLASAGAMRDTFRMYLWRSGTSTPGEFADLIATFQADPAPVQCRYLSIAGTGEGPAFLEQARTWHQRLSVEEKTLIELDASTGADAHCQVNNPTRLAQEVCDWLDEVFDQREAPGDASSR